MPGCSSAADQLDADDGRTGCHPGYADPADQPAAAGASTARTAGCETGRSAAAPFRSKRHHWWSRPTWPSSAPNGSAKPSSSASSSWNVAAEQRRRDEQQRREQERLAEQARLDAQRRQAEATARAEAAERARQAAAAEAASRQYQPIAKKPPVYPQRALDAGLQGACTVSYTVDVQGRVRSPKVVGDCHPLFIRPSLIAAQSFRYQPRIVDGRAVEVPNVQNTFHYRIE